MIDSWDIVLNPENLRKVSDCGVYVLDSPEDIFSIGLRYMRLNADSKNAANYLPVSGMFQKLRHVIKNIIPVSIQEVWLATTFASLSDGQGTASGTQPCARIRLQHKVVYVILNEENLLTGVVFAIPIEAKNVTEA